MLSNLKTYFALSIEFRKFLKETYTSEHCIEIIKKRMEQREENFLEIIKKGIYDNRESPYLKLLEIIDCGFGDIERLVKKIGIEKTLGKLYDSGIYLTYDEFKCRKEVVREGKTFRFKTSDFNNPNCSHHLTTGTGGTTGKSVTAPLDFRYMADTAVYGSFIHDIFDLWEIPNAIWFPVLPGSAGISSMLRNTKIGNPPSKWFSQTDREYLSPLFKNKFHTNGLTYLGRILGTRLPKPEFVELTNAAKIANWTSKMVKEYSGCLIITFMSSAVRICQAARRTGVDISGTKFILGGEPITVSKLKEITSVGAEIIPCYAFAEAGVVGYGCRQSKHIDEVHFFKDLLALIQHKRRIPGHHQPYDAFLFTSILPFAPRILLNVETGDCGTLETRQCGCGFDAVGFGDHVSNIRSFEKITSEGMNVPVSQLTNIVEEILPPIFGGNPTDYQIVETEESGSLTRLNVHVNPELRNINEKQLLETILDRLSEGKKNNLFSDIFTQVETYQVRRIHPICSGGGKIIPVRLTNLDKR